MNLGSVTVLTVLLALVALALHRLRKHGTPCLCDRGGRGCAGCSGCGKTSRGATK